MKTEEIKNMLPHGYSKIVADKAGVSRAAVSKYLSGKSESMKIELAALEVLAELSQKKEKLLRKIK